MKSKTKNRSSKRTAIARFTGLLVVVAILFASVGAALALDKNQLVQMTKLGLDDRAIIGAIDSAGDELSLTQEELGELRLQGVSDRVIDHLKSTGRVEGEQEVAPDPAPADPAPADPAPADPTAPPGDSLEPAPAPSDEISEEELEELQRLEQEREDEIRQKAEELNREKQEAEQRDQRLQQVARQLPEAASLVDANDNMDGARIYLEFLSLDPEPESENWYEAKFGLAKALFQEGILSGASTPLLEVLLAGADRPHFAEGFEMLRVLTRETGYRPPVLEELTQVYIDDLSEGFKNRFNYYMGKFFFDYNKSDLAIEYLQRVGPQADDYAEARYLMGVAKLDTSVDDKAGALRDFEGAIVAEEARGRIDSEISQLGYLALARVFYEIGLYDVALFYYQKLPDNSSRNAESTFEQAWAYFLKNDMKRALGAFHMLHSPYYSKWYYPDLYILEASAYVNLCKFNQAQLALAEFQKKYLDKQPRLQAYLADTVEPRAYWEMMMNVSGRTDSQLEVPRMFVNAVLDDLAFYNIYRVVQNLEVEKRALESNMGALGDFGQSVLDRVSDALDTKVEEGGILVQQKLSDLDQELTDWDLKATQISFDIDSESRDQLQAQLTNPNWQPPEVDTGTTFLVVADDWQSWEFEGEFWIDEVPNYRSSLRTECFEQ